MNFSSQSEPALAKFIKIKTRFFLPLWLRPKSPFIVNMNFQHSGLWLVRKFSEPSCSCQKSIRSRHVFFPLWFRPKSPCLFQLYGLWLVRKVSEPSCSCQKFIRSRRVFLFLFDFVSQISLFVNMNLPTLWTLDWLEKVHAHTNFYKCGLGAVVRTLFFFYLDFRTTLLHNNITLMKWCEWYYHWYIICMTLISSNEV